MSYIVSGGLDVPLRRQSSRHGRGIFFVIVWILRWLYKQRHSVHFKDGQCFDCNDALQREQSWHSPVSDSDWCTVMHFSRTPGKNRLMIVVLSRCLTAITAHRDCECTDIQVVGLLLPNPTLPKTVFWQWLNQSHNACVNYSNRNATKVLKHKKYVPSFAASKKIGI